MNGYKELEEHFAKDFWAPPLERGKFQESPSRIYGARTLVFQAQISNFIAFGPEMAQRNGLKVFCLDWPFLHFSLILRLKSG